MRVNSYYTLLLGFFLAACSSVPMIVRDGKKIPVETAAQLDYTEGETLFQKKQLGQAFIRYRRIVESMPTSKLADNAMFRLAQIYESQKQLAKSQEVLVALTKRYPQGDVTYLALQKLALTYYGQKNMRMAADAFSKLSISQLPSKKKDSYIQMARDSFDKAAMPDEKLIWLCDVYQNELDPIRKSRLAEELKTLFSTNISEATLEKITQKYMRQSPSDLALLRLATISSQNGSKDRLQKWSSHFFESFPMHEQSAYIQSLLKTIESQVSTESSTPGADQWVGVLLPLSGEKAALGKRVWNSIQTAQELLNQQTGSKVQFVVEDIGEDLGRVTAAVQKFSQVNKVIAIVGPLSAEATKIAAEACASERIPLISLSATEKMTELGEHVFRNSLTKSEQANFWARFSAQEMQLRRVAVLYPETPYGSDFMNLFSQAFVLNGGQIVATQSYPSNGKDIELPLKKLVQLSPIESRSKEICSEQESMRRQAIKISGGSIAACYPAKKLPPVVLFEALFVPDGVDAAKQIVPLLPYYDIYGVTVFGPNLWNSSDMLSKNAENLMNGTMFTDSMFQNPKNETAVKFVEKYKQLFNEEPNVLEAQAFDTAIISGHVIKNLRANNRKDFAERLINLRDFNGTQGKISFGPNREAIHELTAYIIDDNQIQELVKQP